MADKQTPQPDSKKDFDVSLTNGAEYPNTNDAPAYIKASEDEANNPTVQGEDHSDHSLQRQKGETQAAYNERIPVAIQPVQPAVAFDYLGRKRV